MKEACCRAAIVKSGSNLKFSAWEQRVSREDEGLRTLDNDKAVIPEGFYALSSTRPFTPTHEAAYSDLFSASRMKVNVQKNGGWR
jgi:hypothetical protein